MTGELSEGILATLLRELYVGRQTGWLHLVRGNERQSIRFRRGHIVNARTNVVEERLGELMVRLGRLSQADLERATEIVLRDKKRLGEVLSELGIMDASTLEDAIATHAYETLAKVFAWSDGSYSFQAEPETPGGEVTLKLSTGELILAAVRAIRDPDVVHYALGDMDRVLLLSSDPILRFQKLTLSPADGFVLSRVDGTASAREILQISPLPQQDAERSLLGLLSTGVVEYSSETRRARRPGPRPASTAGASPQPAATPRPTVPSPPAPGRTVIAPEKTSAAPVQQAPSAPTAGPAAPTATPAPDDEKIESRRREIIEAWDALKTRNHFEVLGLARSAGEVEVKEAYFRLAKRFHPDVHHGESLGDLHDKLEAVFIRLGEAYEVLRDARRRGDYEQRLGRPRLAASGAPPAAAAEAPEGAGTAPSPAEEAAPAEVSARLVEEAIAQANSLFERKQYWDAIQRLEPVQNAAQGRTRSKLRLLLARCYLKNPKWARRAEETLLKVTREDPQLAEAWAQLGGIYEEKGMHARALSMYKKTLELKPDHEQAAHFVAAQRAEEAPPPPEESGGLFRKLFRKP